MVYSFWSTLTTQLHRDRERTTRRTFVYVRRPSSVVRSLSRARQRIYHPLGRGGFVPEKKVKVKQTFKQFPKVMR